MALTEPTHRAVDLDALWPLAEALGELEGDVDADGVDAIAAEAGAPREHAWLALGYAPMVQLVRTQPVAIGVCVGRCQLWGAAPLVAELLALRDRLIAGGHPAFDLVPRGCLSRCERAPVATAVLDDGLVQLDHCTAAQVEKLLHAVEAGHAP